MKLQALNRLTTKLNPTLTVKDEEQLIDKLLCPKGDSARFHAQKCISGACKKCSPVKKSIDVFYKDLSNQKLCENWTTWDRTECEDGKYRRKLHQKQADVNTLIAELVKDIKEPSQGRSFFQHLFDAKWQYRQYHLLLDTLPHDWLLMVVDFGKNHELS